MKRSFLIMATALCVALLSVPALAADDSDMCFQGEGQHALDACTNLILSGKLKNDDLAHAYYRRGSRKDDLGDEAGAIADFDQAIKLKPDYARAYNNRGIAKGKKGDLDGAIADFSKAIKLDPSSDKAYRNRGYAKKLKGDKKGSEADYARARALEGQ